MTTGHTTGCTGTCMVIIPNTGITYQIKLNLVQDAQNIGFFDPYEVSGPFYYIQLSGATSAITKQNTIKFERVITGGTTLAGSGLGTGYSTGIITGSTIPYVSVVVTGSSQSRLTELRKYVVSGTTAQKYVTGGNLTIDGVDLAQTTNYKYTYFLGGIRYIDMLTGTTGTTFRFIAHGDYNNPNFINLPIYQSPNKENIISNPKIYDDVFIIRQELSAFDKNYRLEYIKNLVDLSTYAAGSFFNIVNNT
jgi:hypothetical protein